MAELAFKEFIFKKGSKTTIYLYQSSIEVIHHGLFGKFNKVKLIHYKNIEDIILKQPGLATTGSLIIDCGKNEDKREKINNTIEFSKSEREIALELKTTIDEQIHFIKGQRVNSAVDNFEKLKKLKELADLGILSEEEYIEQKERILEG
ncbi:SHOCT domain-containing protein [Metabacillus malikii]|uniref:SHOCT domain-containing protein n=1 Tax=Metabacillus malikii TaxID=1504265 RepID=A0ABT9ZAF2_9BACI|nr:SHOCT domain-containing protein [Metabacillus malikii]MDQ0228816.1 hypothetical protein [Metabacillus malikii]